MSKKVIGEYSNFYAAKHVMRELIDYGFDPEQILIQARSNCEVYGYLAGPMNSGLVRASGLPAGHEAGAQFGAGIGLTAGITAGLLAWLGPAAGGTPAFLALAGGTVGALAGGLAGWFMGSVIGLGIPENEAEQYAENVRRSSVQVAVQAEHYNVGLIRDVMRRYRPDHIDEQAAISGG